MSNIHVFINHNKTGSNLSKIELFETFGSTLITDLTYAYVLSPSGVIGTVLNIVCAFVLNKAEFKSRKIFKYLKVYVICSAVVCLSLAFIQTLKIYKLADYKKLFITRLIVCYVARPMVLISLYFASVMDILITIERIMAFKPSKNLKKRPPSTLFSCFFLILSIVVNLPLILSLYPAYIDWKVSSNETLNIFYIGVSEFAKSKLGKVFIGLSFFIRDILTTAVGLYLNIWLIVLFKRHVVKKERRFNNILNTNNRCLNEEEQSTAQANLITQTNSLHKTDRKLTFMIIVLSFSTFVEHLIFIVASVSYIVAPGPTTLNVNLSVFLFITIKYALNMFIFSFFNTRFHNSLIQTFKKSKEKQTL